MKKRKKKEDKFATNLRKKLEKILKTLEPKLKVVKNKRFIYKVIIDKNLNYIPNNPNDHDRKYYAFQTDLAIVKIVKKEEEKEKKKEEGILPLVIIETKIKTKDKDITSHDIITYSTKALKHKEIYPYVRYGLVIGGKDKIDNRFFTHNVGFDFAIALKNTEGEELERLEEILKLQLKSAKQLLEIFTSRKRKKVKSFNSIIKVEKRKLKKKVKKRRQ